MSRILQLRQSGNLLSMGVYNNQVINADGATPPTPQSLGGLFQDSLSAQRTNLAQGGYHVHALFKDTKMNRVLQH